MSMTTSKADPKEPSQRRTSTTLTVQPLPKQKDPISAVTLGAAGVFKKNENRMNAKGHIQRGDDSATQKKWKEKGTVDSPAGRSSAPASNPPASSSSAAARTAPYHMWDSGASASLSSAEARTAPYYMWDSGTAWDSQKWRQTGWRTNARVF